MCSQKWHWVKSVRRVSRFAQTMAEHESSSESARVLRISGAAAARRTCRCVGGTAALTVPWPPFPFSPAYPLREPVGIFTWKWLFKSIGSLHKCLTLSTGGEQCFKSCWMLFSPQRGKYAARRQDGCQKCEGLFKKWDADVGDKILH